MGILLIGEKLSGEIFSRGELDLLGVVTGQAATALENARLYEAVRQAYEELSLTQAQNARLEAAVAARARDLAEAHERLTILDRSKDEFLNLISHELRTPLNGLARRRRAHSGRNPCHGGEQRAPGDVRPISPTTSLDPGRCVAADPDRRERGAVQIGSGSLACGAESRHRANDRVRRIPSCHAHPAIGEPGPRPGRRGAAGTSVSRAPRDRRQILRGGGGGPDNSRGRARFGKGCHREPGQDDPQRGLGEVLRALLGRGSEHAGRGLGIGPSRGLPHPFAVRRFGQRSRTRIRLEYD